MIAHTVFHTNILLKIPLLIALPVLLIFQHEYIGSIRVLSIMLFFVAFTYNASNNTKALSIFTFVLVFSLFSTYFYNIVWIQIGHLNDAIRELVANRYCGVRDANNFSFFSNIALCLISYLACFKTERARRTVILLLCIGILATISISGICTMCIVLFFTIGKNGRQVSRLKNILVIIPAVVFILIIISTVFSNSTGVLGTIANRISTISNQLAQGDYSAATSSRTYLWGYYTSQWQRTTGLARSIGAYNVYAGLITTRLGSHNTYIDFLMTYGIIGIIVLGFSFFIPSARKLDKHLWLIKIIAAINILFRSFDPLGTVLLYFIL